MPIHQTDEGYHKKDQRQKKGKEIYREETKGKRGQREERRRKGRKREEMEGKGTQVGRKTEEKEGECEKKQQGRKGKKT